MLRIVLFIGSLLGLVYFSLVVEMALPVSPRQTSKSEPNHVIDAKSLPKTDLAESYPESNIPQESIVQSIPNEAINSDPIAQLQKLIFLYNKKPTSEIAAEISLMFLHEFKDEELAQDWLKEALSAGDAPKEAIHEFVYAHKSEVDIKKGMLFLDGLPQTPSINVARGQMLFRLGNYTEAEPYLEVARETGDAEALGQLAIVYQNQGKDWQAHEAYEMSLQLMKQSIGAGEEDLLEEYRRRFLLSAKRVQDFDGAEQLVSEMMMEDPAHQQKLQAYFF